jgi:hypothetical protein
VESVACKLKAQGTNDLEKKVLLQI